MSQIVGNQVIVRPLVMEDGYGFTFIDKSASRVDVMQPIEFPPVYKHYEHGEALGEDAMRPSFWLNREATQALFDAMYEAGIRPTRRGSEEANVDVLRAVNRHINDMRAITFGLLRKSGVDMDGEQNIDSSPSILDALRNSF